MERSGILAGRLLCWGQGKVRSPSFHLSGMIWERGASFGVVFYLGQRFDQVWGLGQKY